MNLPAAPARPCRIVVRGVNWLGDAVMTAPALMRLRETFPEAFIALSTPEKLAPLWQGHPSINAVESWAPAEGPFIIARRLREHRFDSGVVFPNSFRSALELWSAGIPRRVGYGTQWRRWLLTDTVAPRLGAVRMHKRSRKEIQSLIENNPGGGDKVASLPALRANAGGPEVPGAAHHIYQYLHLVAQLGASGTALAPQLYVSPGEVAEFVARIHRNGSRRQLLFGLNPGAEYGPAKRWPAERFIAAARALQERTECAWLVFGGSGDSDLAEQIVSGIRVGRAEHKYAVYNLAGKTSLRELCAGLKACRLLLTNDTGPMHVAAALGTPVVVPFGSTCATLTGPGLPGSTRHELLQARVPCSPCFLRQCPIDFRCMRSIGVEGVIEAVLRVWQDNGPSL